MNFRINTFQQRHRNKNHRQNIVQIQCNAAIHIPLSSGSIILAISRTMEEILDRHLALSSDDAIEIISNKKIYTHTPTVIRIKWELFHQTIGGI